MSVAIDSASPVGNGARPSNVVIPEGDVDILNEDLASPLPIASASPVPSPDIPRRSYSPLNLGSLRQNSTPQPQGDPLSKSLSSIEITRLRRKTESPLLQRKMANQDKISKDNEGTNFRQLLRAQSDFGLMKNPLASFFPDTYNAGVVTLEPTEQEEQSKHDAEVYNAMERLIERGRAKVKTQDPPKENGANANGGGVKGWTWLLPKLWKKGCESKLSVPLLECIIFSGGQPTQWLFPSKDGTILRKNKDKLKAKTIRARLIELIKRYPIRQQRYVAMVKIRDTERDNALYTLPISSEDLQALLPDKGNTSSDLVLIQPFVIPKGRATPVILHHATWDQRRPHYVTEISSRIESHTAALSSKVTVDPLLPDRLVARSNNKALNFELNNYSKYITKFVEKEHNIRILKCTLLFMQMTEADIVLIGGKNIAYQRVTHALKPRAQSAKVRRGTPVKEPPRVASLTSGAVDELLRRPQDTTGLYQNCQGDFCNVNPDLCTVAPNGTPTYIHRISLEGETAADDLIVVANRHLIAVRQLLAKQEYAHLLEQDSLNKSKRDNAEPSDELKVLQKKIHANIGLTWPSEYYKEAHVCSNCYQLYKLTQGEDSDGDEPDANEDGTGEKKVSGKKEDTRNFGHRLYEDAMQQLAKKRSLEEQRNNPPAPSPTPATSTPSRSTHGEGGRSRSRASRTPAENTASASEAHGGDAKPVVKTPARTRKTSPQRASIRSKLKARHDRRLARKHGEDAATRACPHTVFHLDDLGVSLPYAILGSRATPSDKTDKGSDEHITEDEGAGDDSGAIVLLVFNDVFETISKQESVYQYVVEKAKGVLAVLFNYPGQAYSTWPNSARLSNEYIGGIVEQFFMHMSEVGVFRPKDKFILCGSGYGGNIAGLFAQLRPDLKPRALVLANPFGSVDDHLQMVLSNFISATEMYVDRQLARKGEVDDFSEPFFYSLFSHLFYSMESLDDPQLRSQVLADAARRMNPISSLGRLHLCIGMLTSASIADGPMTDVGCPLVLIQSEQDQFVLPQNSESFKTSRTETESLSIAVRDADNHYYYPVTVDCGHDIFAEKPDSVADVIVDMCQEMQLADTW